MDVTQRDDEVIEEWKKKLTSIHTTRADMNRLVMNYLEKEGFKEAAEKFRVESGVSASIDLDTIDQRIQIRDHLLNGDISSAVALINEIHPELLDNDNSLYFKLQQQQLIELIRQKELEKALDFAQIQLSERAEEGDVEVLAELERTLALLAFDDPTTSPFGDLLQPAHRYKVASEVNAKILEQENQESVPQITKILKLLAWSQQQLDAKKLNAIDPHLIQNTCMYIDPKTGRYVKPEWKDAPTGDSYRPSYNIGPTIFTPVLLSSAHHGEKVSSGRVIQPMRWGLIPSWHKGGRAAFKAMHNNCRGETISEKGTFSAPFNRGKRCVVIAEGFYEWKTEGKIKHPYLFTMKSDHQDVCKSGDDGQILKTEQQDDKQSHTKQEIKSECEPKIDSSNLESKTSLTVDLKPVKQEVVEEYNNHTDTGEIETADVKSESTKVGVLDLKQENRRDDTAESPSTKQQSHADTGNKAASGRDSHFSSPQSLIFMAGIFDVCKEEGGLLYSYSVLTTSAVGAVKDIHHRMPVILKTEEDIDRWLNYQDHPASKVKDLIRSQDCLCSHRVSDKVNNVRYNEPDCVLKLPPETLNPKTMMKNDLRNWFTKKEPQPSSVKRRADSVDMPQQTMKKLK